MNNGALESQSMLRCDGRGQAKHMCLYSCLHDFNTAVVLSVLCANVLTCGCAAQARARRIAWHYNVLRPEQASLARQDLCHIHLACAGTCNYICYCVIAMCTMQAGALAEFRADWSTAVKTYQTAYSQVQKVPLGSLLPLQHWSELTSVAEQVHIKVRRVTKVYTTVLLGAWLDYMQYTAALRESSRAQHSKAKHSMARHSTEHSAVQKAGCSVMVIQTTAEAALQLLSEISAQCM